MNRRDLMKTMFAVAASAPVVKAQASEPEPLVDWWDDDIGPGKVDCVEGWSQIETTRWATAQTVATLVSLNYTKMSRGR